MSSSLKQERQVSKSLNPRHQELGTDRDTVSGAPASGDREERDQSKAINPGESIRHQTSITRKWDNIIYSQLTTEKQGKQREEQ